MEKVTYITKVNKSFSEKEFFREALIQLYKSGAPQDIFDCEFGEVKTSEVEFLGVTCKDIKVNYTCSVGFDREESYWDTEAYYDSNHNKCTRNVLKTRIVTDWKPFSGTTESDKETCVVKNCEPDRSDYEEEQRFNESILAGLKAEEATDCSNDGEMSINAGVLERAKSLCCEHCFLLVDLPGDRRKDINETGVATVDNVVGFLATEYSLEFKYEEKVYHAKSYASGKPNVVLEVPSNEKQVKEGNKQIKRKLRPLTIGIVLLCIAAILCGGLIPVFTHDYTIPWYLIFGLPAIAVLVIYFVIRWNLVKKTEKKWQARKLEDLNFLLRKYKLEEYYE